MCVLVGVHIYMCMLMCTCVCLCVRMHVPVYTHVCVYVHMCAYECLCLHVYLCVHMCVLVSVYICMSMFVCTHVCACVEREKLAAYSFNSLSGWALCPSLSYYSYDIKMSVQLLSSFLAGKNVNKTSITKYYASPGLFVFILRNLEDRSPHLERKNCFKVLLYYWFGLVFSFMPSGWEVSRNWTALQKVHFRSSES